MKETKKDKIF